MVVTFITDFDYSRSAQNLDSLRLKKQCVEAFQILNVLDDLHFLADKLGLPKCPEIDISCLYKQNDWVEKVRTAYQKLDYYYYYQDGSIMKTEKDCDFFIIDKTYILDKHYFIEGDCVIVLMKPADYRKQYDSEYKDRNRVEMKFDRCDVIIKELGDRVIKLGYANHPAARMWLTYEESLIQYLNQHLEEYYRRTGKDMNIPQYKVKNEVRPWWLRKELVMSHLASLLRKDSKYYSDIFSIPDKYRNLGYIWPASLNRPLAEDLVDEYFNPSMFAEAKGI